MAEQRLIDANNLIEEIREERCYNCRNFKDMKCDYCGTADYIYMIEDMPTADVAPVVHGRWIMVDDSCGKYACSACREIEQECTEWGAGHYNPVYKDYCPNCGAKMDETVEENKR